MTQASEFAKKLAEETGVDVDLVQGTGKDGLVTKADVQKVAETAAETNIMAKAKLERVKQGAPGNEPLPQSTEVVVPSQQEMLDIIASMQQEITSLREDQAGLIERESHSRDLTDELFFIAKANGKRWDERRIIDNQTVNVEFVATSFVGPFNDEDEVESYLTEKRSKRADSYLDWANIKVVSGREARQIDADEKAEREAQFVTSAPVNVLDRRIFAAEHGTHVPGVGQLAGQQAD